MSEIIVASTTDAQKEIDRAAGLEVKEQAEAPEKKEGEEPEQQEAQHTDEQKKLRSKERIRELARDLKQRDDEVEQLKQRLAKLEKGTTERQATEEEVKAAEEAAKAPETPPKPTPDKYQTYEDYVEALADWKADEKIRQITAKAEEKKAEEAAKAAENAVFAGYRERLDEARERYEDFDDVAFKESIPIYEGVKAIIIQHANGPDLQYYLAKNPKIARELSEMPVEMAMARAGAIAEQLGRTEEQEPTSEKIEREAEKEEKPNAFTPRRATNAAPPPIRPVGGSATKSSVPIDDLPYAEYRKIRDNQEKQRYRR